MESFKYLLLGGGLASVRAARQFDRLDRGASIAIISEEPELPYDRPPLSKEYMRGEKERNQVFLEPDSFYQERGIRTILGRSAKSIEPEEKIVTVEGAEATGYEKLLIATGARPRKLDVPGSDLPGIYYLRTIRDCESIRSEATPGRRALIVGAGFIGMEVAASVTQRGVRVTVVEVMPHIWGKFLDRSMAEFFQRYCEARSITFLTNETVSDFYGGERVAGAIMGSGKKVDFDYACIGVGVLPNSEVAQGAGLKVSNGVIVDEFMRTSSPDVFAVGDVANFYDPLFARQRRVEHWGHAEYSGMLAAQNMAGSSKAYDLLTYVWSDIFDLHLEFAGDESENDEVIIRGRFEDESFCVLYLKQKMLRAYFAVNTPPREFGPLQMLIKRKVDLTGKSEALKDKSYNLRALLSS